MRIWRTLRVLAPLLVLLVAALPGYGQVDYATATLKGTVLDAQGAAVPGAVVTIINPATGLTKTQNSSAEGTYQFQLLPVGTYQVEVTAAGFDKAVAKDIALAVGQAVVVDLHLTVGAASTVVEVTTTAPLIATEQVQQANDINQTQVDQLPNVNRTFDTYVQTLPGISDAEAIHASGSQRFIGAFPTNAFTTSGGNGRGGLVTIDGGENDYGSGITRTYHLPVDSIQEFQVNRNGYNAEYGFSYNEAVSIVTKSGTNNYHGLLFGTFRDQATDAAQYFQPVNPVTGGKLFEQDFHAGGNFGGALVKDKLFFFLAYEGYQTSFKTFANFQTGADYVAPTAYQQDFILLNGPATTCGNLIEGPNKGTPECGTGGLTAGQATALATVLTPKLNPIPFANGLIGAPGNAFGIPNQSGFFTNRDTWHDGVVRFDWQPNSTDTFTVRGLIERRDNPGSFGGGSLYSVTANTPPDAATGLFNRDYEIVTSWSHIFSPTVVNAFRFQAVPEYLADLPNLAATGSTRVAFNLLLDGYGVFGPTLGANPNYLSLERRYQFEDSISLTHGAHSFKFGLSYRPARYTITDGLYAHSQIVYAANVFPVNLSIFLPSYFKQAGISEGYTPPPLPPGLPAYYSNIPSTDALQAFDLVLPVQFRTSFGNPTWHDWGHYGGIYAQDSWKITPRLTISPGVRFDVNAEPFPGGGAQAICEPNGFQTAATVGATTCTGASPTGTQFAFQTNPQTPYTFYLSPRLGLAYDLTGDHKTVLRASGGVYTGASELQAVYYSNLYNPNGNYLSQAEVTAGVDPKFFGLVGVSLSNNHLPVLPPTAGDFTTAGLTVGPGQPHGVFIVQGDRPCGAQKSGGIDPFGCGTYRSTYSTQASLSIQRELTSNMSLEVGYDFQRTFHLQDPLEGNFTQAKDPTGQPLVDPFLGPMLVPINPNVETGTIYCSCGDAWYHGMTTTLTRRFADHLQFQANYTYSRSIDDVLDFSSFNSSFYPTLFPKGIGGKGRDRGQSAYNLSHIFTANAVYTTPFQTGHNVLETALADISISPIVSIHSGIPFEVLINPGQGLGGECTTVVTCDGGGATSNGLVQEALNQARPFAAPRNTGVGPWDYRWDMSLRKGVYLNKERGLKLEVSANISNLLNRVNFLGVNGIFPNVTNAGAAQCTALVKTGCLPNGGSLLAGPYVLHGNKATDVAEKKGTQGFLTLGQDPLAFNSADVPRQAQFALRLSF
ncbi:MAG TPA: carboxypeptidase-like regulatory domain-containing protein [Candidatus Acidoferrales bacterium]|nr:carboxypeptidase-like regulatory domain-containing protein [Candidatus Acidoferrales bacterium]